MKKVFFVVSVFLLTLAAVIGLNASPVAAQSEFEEYLWSDSYEPTEEKAEVLRLYRAFFDRDPDPNGAEYWVGVSESGASLDQIAIWFSQGSEFAANYAGTTNSQYVAAIYENVLNRPADGSGFTYWLGQLNTQTLDRPGIVRWIAANPEFADRYQYPNLADLAVLTDGSELGADWTLSIAQTDFSLDEVTINYCNQVVKQTFPTFADSIAFYRSTDGSNLGNSATIMASQADAADYVLQLGPFFRDCLGERGFTGAYNTAGTSDDHGMIVEVGDGENQFNVSVLQVGKVLYISQYSGPIGAATEISATDLLNGSESMYQRLVASGNFDLIKAGAPKPVYLGCGICGIN